MIRDLKALFRRLTRRWRTRPVIVEVLDGKGTVLSVQVVRFDSSGRNVDPITYTPPRGSGGVTVAALFVHDDDGDDDGDGTVVPLPAVHLDADSRFTYDASFTFTE